MTVTVKQSLPCFLCGGIVRVKKTKRLKPYFICEKCGLQTFIRYKEGISRLDRLVTSLRRKPGRFIANETHVYRLLQLLSRLEELEFHYIELQEPRTTDEYVLGVTDRDQELKAVAVEIKRTRQEIAKSHSRKPE